MVWGAAIEPDKLDKSGFSRQLHALAVALLDLFATLGQMLKALPPGARGVMGSFPVAGGHKTRSEHSGPLFRAVNLHCLMNL